MKSLRLALMLALALSDIPLQTSGPIPAPIDIHGTYTPLWGTR